MAAENPRWWDDLERMYGVDASWEDIWPNLKHIEPTLGMQTSQVDNALRNLAQVMRPLPQQRSLLERLYIEEPRSISGHSTDEAAIIRAQARHANPNWLTVGPSTTSRPVERALLARMLQHENPNIAMMATQFLEDPTNLHAEEALWPITAKGSGLGRDFYLGASAGPRLERELASRAGMEFPYNRAMHHPLVGERLGMPTEAYRTSDLSLRSPKLAKLMNEVRMPNIVGRPTFMPVIAPIAALGLGLLANKFKGKEGVQGTIGNVASAIAPMLVGA